MLLFYFLFLAFYHPRVPFLLSSAKCFLAWKEVEEGEIPRATSGQHGTVGPKESVNRSARLAAAQVENLEPADTGSDLSSASSHEEDPLLYKPREAALPNTNPRSQSALAKQFLTTYALLSSGRLAAAMYGRFVQVAVISSFDSKLPLFVHQTFDWDPSATGLILLATTVPSLAGPLLGVLSGRLGTRILMLGGFTLATLALTLLSLVTDNSTEHKALLWVLFALAGFGTTMMLTPLTTDIFCVVEKMGDENEGLFGPGGAYAKAYGIFDTALAIGAIFGSTDAGLIYKNAEWKAVAWALAAFCVMKIHGGQNMPTYS
ncbi:MAG: hypothetical protein Q9164_000989 [Protoblastenia rupestris]